MPRLSGGKKERQLTLLKQMNWLYKFKPDDWKERSERISKEIAALIGVTAFTGGNQ